MQKIDKKNYLIKNDNSVGELDEMIKSLKREACAVKRLHNQRKSSCNVYFNMIKYDTNHNKKL